MSAPTRTCLTAVRTLTDDVSRTQFGGTPACTPITFPAVHRSQRNTISTTIPMRPTTTVERHLLLGIPSSAAPGDGITTDSVLIVRHRLDRLQGRSFAHGDGDAFARHSFNDLPKNSAEKSKQNVLADWERQQFRASTAHISRLAPSAERSGGGLASSIPRHLEDTAKLPEPAKLKSFWRQGHYGRGLDVLQEPGSSGAGGFISAFQPNDASPAALNNARPILIQEISRYAEMALTCPMRRQPISIFALTFSAEAASVIPARPPESACVLIEQSHDRRTA
ncbi:hypothetical protein HDK64DRAFT_258977 [Phyllosticta capitalensis]